MNKSIKITYWISTGLISIMMLMSAGMYIIQNEEISEVFNSLGYPSFVIYPLAIAKILAVITILGNFSKSLKEWAYAGLFFDFLLAFQAHFMAGDGELAPSLVATTLLLISYFSGKRLNR